MASFNLTYLFKGLISTYCGTKGLQLKQMNPVQSVSVLVNFPYLWDKLPNTCNLKEERFPLAHCVTNFTTGSADLNAEWCGEMLAT